MTELKFKMQKFEYENKNMREEREHLIAQIQ